MSVALLLGLGIVLFFGFFAYMGRLQKAGAQALPAASRRLEIRSGPDATAEAIASLLARADLRSGPLSPSELVSILPALGAARAFPLCDWEPADLSEAARSMHERLREMGLEHLSREDVHTRLAQDAAAHPTTRREQVSAVLSRVNAKLEEVGDPRRFREYAEDLPGWDPDEPAWLLCDEAEHQILLDRDILRSK